MRSRPGGACNTSALQVCLEGSNWREEGGARLLCLSMPKKPRVRATRMAGPKSPRLEEREHSLCSRGGKIGKRLRGGVLIVSDTALNRDDMGKESMEGRGKPLVLCKNRTPDK